MQATKTISPKNGNIHAKFYALAAQVPGFEKEEWVWRYSHLLTTSLSEFHAKLPEDYAKMLADMEHLTRNSGAAPKTTDNQAAIKKLRSGVLHRLQKHGIDTTDWNKVNAFMRQPRIAGKTLGEMTIPELQALIPKLESILKKDVEVRKHVEYLTRCN